MTTFLDRVVRERQAAADEARRSGPDLAAGLQRAPAVRSLAAAIAGRRATGQRAIIAELKRVSPAAGVLADAGIDPSQIARIYAAAGAAAISVLTEPGHWGGSLDDLRRVRAAVDLPLLCKDVIVDARQIREARADGADAILLIAEALDDRRLALLLDEARALGLEALVEAHDPPAFDRAVRSGARLVGVNARDLRDPGTVDRERIRMLAGRVAATQLLVAESGIGSAAEVTALPARVDAVLVGSALMRAGDPGSLLRELVSAPRPAGGGA